MRTITTINELRDVLRAERREGRTVGFVPTMGFLHEGHISLVNRAKEICDVVVMSIFVNPLQFGPNEDFDRYPRDIPRDSKLAEEAGVSYLFTPGVEEMYPSKMLTNVSVAEVTEPLCGASRPGHFDGVATVVTKLFNIVQPHYAFFGQKDAQQLAVIEQMVYDLSMPVTIVPCPTLREADGLALSSRNVYLSAEEREQALALSRSLRQAQAMVEAGERDVATIRDAVASEISQQPLAVIDYVELLQYPRLGYTARLAEGDRVLLALAVKFGKTRLIDNIIMNV
ncbi:pantoate--beta-alanine ligase [Brevibacillus dissolubilis]|uniref:pantoate--beta-alanine ligase n=1 Tax=Brevibacillus dissolubilis TaxID=1844116 RepID=UPI001115D0E4|nr:pantoate--beta-alanine ligase [Brevibacillus dissolubilis]